MNQVRIQTHTVCLCSSTWLYAAVAGLPVMVVSGIQTQPGPAQVLWPGGQIPVHEPLRFRPDGTFQISIFEDLHFGESAYLLAYLHA